jgi:hypothetical protein
MALAVEDGSGGDPLANVYISAADADTYFLERNKTAWAGSAAVKEAAILAAADYLEYAYDWKGSRISDEQPMQWPRVTGPTDSLDRRMSYNVVPKEVIKANAELALLALTGDLMPAQTGGKLLSESVSVGGAVTRSRTYAGGGADGTARRFPFIDRMLARWATGGSTGVRGVPIERA